MRLKIKTTFWEREDTDLRTKVGRLLIILIIFQTANTGWFIFEFSWLMTTFNSIVYLILIIMFTSYEKWKKEIDKKENEEWEKEERIKSGKRRDKKDGKNGKKK